MPESFPNAFTIDGVGNVATEFLLLAGTPTTDKVINWGYCGPIFINGILESNTATVPHGLGVVPELVLLQNTWTDSGRFCIFFVDADATNFRCFVRDMTGAAHGPGNLADVFFWVAIG